MARFIPFSETPIALAHRRCRQWEEEDRSYKRRFNELQEEKMKAEIQMYKTVIEQNKAEQNEEIAQLKKQIQELKQIQFQNEKIIKLLMEEKEKAHSKNESR